MFTTSEPASRKRLLPNTPIGLYSVSTWSAWFTRVVFFCVYFGFANWAATNCHLDTLPFRLVFAGLAQAEQPR